MKAICENGPLKGQEMEIRDDLIENGKVIPVLEMQEIGDYDPSCDLSKDSMHLPVRYYRMVVHYSSVGKIKGVALHEDK